MSSIIRAGLRGARALRRGQRPWEESLGPVSPASRWVERFVEGRGFLCAPPALPPWVSQLRASTGRGCVCWAGLGEGPSVRAVCWERFAGGLHLVRIVLYPNVWCRGAGETSGQSRW